MDTMHFILTHSFCRQKFKKIYVDFSIYNSITCLKNPKSFSTGSSMMWMTEKNLLVQLGYNGNGVKEYNNPCNKNTTNQDNMKANAWFVKL